MKNFAYTKINGAGNDFVLIDLAENPDLELKKEEVEKICDRSNGIGAGGILLIGSSKKLVFEMTYFNADGSTGSLCGNGARCAVKYVSVAKKIDSKSIEFECENEEYRGEIIGESVVKFYLKPPSMVKVNFKVKVHNQLITAHYADTGSPHVIIDISDVLSDPKNLKSGFSDINLFPVELIGREVRNLPEFAPGGVNVNFVKINDEEIKIRSFEKGVEAETLACGTGAVAAALILNIIHNKNAPVKLITKSKAELIVNFDIENESFINVSLTGPVEIEKKSNYSI